MLMTLELAIAALALRGSRRTPSLRKAAENAKMLAAPRTAASEMVSLAVMAVAKRCWSPIAARCRAGLAERAPRQVSDRGGGAGCPELGPDVVQELQARGQVAVGGGGNLDDMGIEFDLTRWKPSRTSRALLRKSQT